MLSQFMITTANVLQGLVPLLTLVGYVPQWRRLITTRSSKDISLSAWILWTVTTFIGLFYALVQYLLAGYGWVFLFSAVANLLFVVITVALIFAYREGNSFTHRPAVTSQYMLDTVTDAIL